MTLQQIASALKGNVNGSWINIRGPGHSHNDKSLGFCFDRKSPGGLRINSFANEDPDLCRAHITSLLEKAAKTLPTDLDVEYGKEERHRISSALALFAETTPILGTIAEKYLLSRGISPETINAAASVLGFHPNMPFGDGIRAPALAALIMVVSGGEPSGIQRIALADDGSGKRFMHGGAKKNLGVARGAVALRTTLAPSIAVAEGIETALSASQLYDRPVMAALSAGGIAHFPIVRGVRHLTIFADHDNVGLMAAQDCRFRYNAAGIDVAIRIPRARGADWNDFLGNLVK